MTIRKIGNARGCMLSPTIIGGDSSSCRDAQITAAEKAAMMAGMTSRRGFIGGCSPEGAPPRCRGRSDYSIRPISFSAGPNSPTIALICSPHGPEGCGEVESRPEFVR